MVSRAAVSMFSIMVLSVFPYVLRPYCKAFQMMYLTELT